jgi:hypothetical protein
MNISKRLAAAVLLGASALAVSGCAASLPTKVTRFQAMPVAQGQTFAIVPGMGAARGGGLEFSQYAQLVAQQLAVRGYRQVATPQQAQFVVQLGYGVDNGRQVIVEDPFVRSRLNDPFYRGFYGSRFGYDPFWGVYRGRPYYSRFGYAGYRSPFYYGWDDPFWHGGGISSYTEYRSKLELDIRDRATNQPLFEGQAQARSQTDELGTLVPNLVEAMFTGFPGRSGETVRITVPAKKRG